MTERLLTAQQLAEHLQVSYATVTNMAKRGEIPALKVGRVWRFDLDEVREALLRPTQDLWAQPPRAKATRVLMRQRSAVDTFVDTNAGESSRSKRA